MKKAIIVGGVVGVGTWLILMNLHDHSDPSFTGQTRQAVRNGVLVGVLAGVVRYFV